jgi:hypothetical protein
MNNLTPFIQVLFHAMPRGLPIYEQVVNFMARDDNNIPGPSLEPSQQSQSQQPYRGMKPDEEIPLVQLAVPHAHLRESDSVAAFAYEVGVSFQTIYGWQFKSVARKLTDLERNWRVTLRNRGSGAGTENDTDISQAMEKWLKIIDEEKARKVERQAVAIQARQERDTASTWRTDLVLDVIKPKQIGELIGFSLREACIIYVIAISPLI